MGGRLFRFGSMGNRDQRSSLSGMGAFINDALHLAVALENRAGPSVHDDKTKAVEAYVAKKSSVNADDLDPATSTVRRARFELTGT